MKIENIKKNCMGTLSLTCKFNGMRKSQEFIVYPLKASDETNKILIQSDTRIGHIFLSSGDVSLCPPVSSGAYSPHLMFAKTIDKLNDDELVNLKLSIFTTKGEKVGDNALQIFTDNSGADKVLII